MRGKYEELVGGEEAPGEAVDHLLIGGRRRTRAAAGVVDQELDRRAVDDIEADQFAGAVMAELEGRRVEHEKILEERAARSQTGARHPGGARIARGAARGSAHRERRSLRRVIYRFLV